MKHEERTCVIRWNPLGWAISGLALLSASVCAYLRRSAKSRCLANSNWQSQDRSGERSGTNTHSDKGYTNII